MNEQNQLMTTNEVFEAVYSALERAANAVEDDEGAIQALTVVYQGYQQLQAAMDHTEAVAAGALAVADDLRAQRDLALDDLDWQRRKKRGSTIRDLARYLAYDGKIAVGDAERVLDVLFGEKELPISQYTKDDFFNAFGVLAEELFAEEIFQAEAEAEYDAEVAGQYDDD